MHFNKYFDFLQLEAKLIAAIGSVEIRLMQYEVGKKNLEKDEKYLENREIINTLVEVKSSVGSYMMELMKERDRVSKLVKENRSLKESLQLKEKELETLRKSRLIYE